MRGNDIIKLLSEYEIKCGKYKDLFLENPLLLECDIMLYIQAGMEFRCEENKKLFVGCRKLFEKMTDCFFINYSIEPVNDKIVRLILNFEIHNLDKSLQLILRIPFNKLPSEFKSENCKIITRKVNNDFKKYSYVCEKK